MARQEGPRRFRGLERRRLAGVEVPVAEGVAVRLLGLALLAPERSGPGLLIPRCSAVHTFGMRFALDLVFLGAGGTELRRVDGVGPGRFVREPGAAAVLELSRPTRTTRSRS